MLQEVIPGLFAHVGTTAPSNSVAAFDLDWTLIRTYKGRFPKDATDFKFLPNRLSTLKSIQDKGYTLVIFTNQGYTGAKLILAKDRINTCIGELNQNNINPWVFMSSGHDVYRKPNIGMWQTFAQYIPQLDLTTSFYVGDAAGRVQDHSSDDILFAQNIGLPFYTPEQIFPNNTVTIPNTQSMFIFVGMPGSGKTTWYEKNLKPLGWFHANQDTLGTPAKVMKAIIAALSQGQSVAVDATNTSIEKRQSYIDTARNYNVLVTILYFVGDGYGWNKLRPKPVPDIAYSMYYKHLVEPVSGTIPVIELM